jgi:4-carboxymuconolactone decarboxylase
MRQFIFATALTIAVAVGGLMGFILHGSASAADTPEKRAKGIEMFNKVYGGIVQLPPTQGVAFQELVLDNLFADIWSREIMTIRDRRLVLMGVIAAQGEASTFGTQMRAALSKGEITPAQANEIILILTQYIGYPHTTQLLPEVAKAIEVTQAKK